MCTISCFTTSVSSFRQRWFYCRACAVSKLSSARILLRRDPTAVFREGVTRSNNGSNSGRSSSFSTQHTAESQAAAEGRKTTVGSAARDEKVELGGSSSRGGQSRRVHADAGPTNNSGGGSRVRGGRRLAGAMDLKTFMHRQRVLELYRGILKVRWFVFSRYGERRSMDHKI